MKYLYIATVSDYTDSGITEIKDFDKGEIDILVKQGFVNLSNGHVEVTDEGDKYYKSLGYDDFFDSYGDE